MNFWFDLKYAWRLSTKSWGHSLLTAAVVALSVGLALWAYLLAYSVALKPLGFPGSDDWYSVQLTPDATAVAQPSVDAFTYQEIRKRTPAFDHLGAFSNRSVVLSEGEASISVHAADISPRLLSATQVAPYLGRVFNEADSERGAAPAAVLGYETWKNYFAADPDIIGKTTRIDARPVRIIGVMPQDFFAFQDFELWLPLQLTQLARPDSGDGGDNASATEQGVTGSTLLSPIVVLQKGQSQASVALEMNAAVEDVNRSYPDLFNVGRHVELIPALRMFTHPKLPIIGTITVMAGAVLILGCVNISMMFLARLLERSRELALRTALGASRPRLLRQCLLETAFVVLLGLVIGSGLTYLGVAWTQDLSNFMSQMQAKGRDPNLLVLRSGDLLVAALAATVVWLLSTLMPAWRVANQDAALTLAGSGKGGANRGTSNGANVLVGVQVLISALVLVICGNLVLAVNHEANKPTGLADAQVMISTYPTVFNERYVDPATRLNYWDDLRAKIETTMPGARATFATAVPTQPTAVAMTPETREGRANQGELKLPLTAVAENYFELLGIKLRSGRLFDSTDNADSLNVAVVDETLVRRYWPREDALGKRIQLDPNANGPWLTIVGVVAPVAGQPFTPDRGAVYRPLRQAAPPAFHLLTRLPNVAADSRVDLRAAAFAVDRDLVLHNLQLLDDYLSAVNMNFKALVPVFITLASITVLLAATGLFGLISRSVAMRTHEVGLRRALGASPVRAISMFLRQGAMYLAVGVVAVGLGIVVTNLLSTAFPNIMERVLLVTPSIVLLLAAVIFTATYLPTRRAVSLEPGDALRYE